MLRRVPSDLPLFAASLFGLSFMAFGYTAMYTEGAVGRPSQAGAGALIQVWESAPGAQNRRVVMSVLENPGDVEVRGNEAH